VLIGHSDASHARLGVLDPHISLRVIDRQEDRKDRPQRVRKKVVVNVTVIVVRALHFREKWYESAVESACILGIRT
jgi:hypothetical protein